jgi:hypothetical protein
MGTNTIVCSGHTKACTCSCPTLLWATLPPKTRYFSYLPLSLMRLLQDLCGKARRKTQYDSAGIASKKVRWHGRSASTNS